MLCKWIDAFAVTAGINEIQAKQRCRN